MDLRWSFLGILFSIICRGKSGDGENVRGICERCNNIDSAMTGYDVSGMAIVDPQLHNPAIKGIIFDVDDDTRWIDTYKEIGCMGSFEMTSYTNFSEYIFGASQSHSSQYNFQLGEDSTIGTPGTSPVAFSTTVPPPFSRGHGSNESAQHMEDHYKKSEGSVSHAEARCNIYTVTIYPENPDVKFTDNFVNRLKQIDKAESITEKNSVMKAFIQEFGTHFGTKTTMGVGLKFETRFTQEETKDNSENTLNWCNSVSGARLFGIQLEDDTVDCNKPSLTVTTGTVNGVTRFSSSSYGSYPKEKLSDWQSAIEVSDAMDTLDPLPLKQEYDLIMNLFSTPAIAAIEHSDGTLINTTRLLDTALAGYAQYCHLLDDVPCQVIGCANSIRLGEAVFHYALTDEHNRMIFQEWTTSPSKNQLFFKENHWFISEGPWEIENPELKSADCPINKKTFFSLSIDIQTQASDWKSCSDMCIKRGLCNYWEYRSANERCILMKDFEFMLETSEDILIGTRDCPGEKQLRDSVFGACVEHHPSMWLPRGETFFQKELKVETNDPTNIVVAGGYKKGTLGGYNIASVEVIGNYDCPWPLGDLPNANREQIMAMTPGGTVLVCGGDQDYDRCNSYDISLKQWVPHSTLRATREASTAVTLPSGVYILGGFMEPFSSEILPRGSDTWIDGPAVPIKASESCSVAISDNAFAVIGGGDFGAWGELVGETYYYYAAENKWTQGQSLNEARKGHGCAKLGGKIIVAGGVGKRDNGLASTEIIDISTGVVRSGAPMLTERKYFRMATVGGGQYQKVLAIGGHTDGIAGHDIASVEEWNAEEEGWVLSPTKLATARHKFSLVVVPSARICSL